MIFPKIMRIFAALLYIIITMKRFFIAFSVVASFVLQLGFFSCTTKPSGFIVLLDSVSVDSVCPLFHSYEKPACHFSLRMEVPYVEEDASLSHSLQRFLSSIPRQGAFAEDSDGTVQGMADNYLHSYIMQYLQEGKEAIDSYGEDMDAAATWMSYEEQAEGHVVYQEGSFLSYQFKVYSFMGGAHGNTVTNNRVFDLENQMDVTLSTLFTDESLNVVGEKLREALAVQNDCQTVDELIQTGIFFSAGDIEPNDNFLLDEKGLTWVYDPYEIAPYALGPVTVSLPWSEIKDLLYPDSSVKAFAETKAL